MRCILVLSLLAFSHFCYADVLTVDDDDDGFADFTSIQTAIDNAKDGDTIEVQPGTYFERINFYGKAVTVTGTAPEDESVVRGTIIDGESTGDVVKFNNGEDETSELIGLTIQNGTIGISLHYSSPLISKCVIRANGDGIIATSSSTHKPIIIDCFVEENTGFGIYECDGNITRCIIKDNGTGLILCDGKITYCSVVNNGGLGFSNCGGLISHCRAIGNGHGFYNCSANISHCVIAENYTGLFLCNGELSYLTVSKNSNIGINSCSGEISNCIINGNLGIGMDSCSAQITNCTIVGNKGHGIQCQFGKWSLINCIITNNGRVGIKVLGSVDYFEHNNVWRNLQGNYQGIDVPETDIHVKPLFAIAGYWDGDQNWVDGEYHLKSVTGRWAESGWVTDDVSSPCIDAGSPEDSVGVEPNPNGGRVNMGAYGGTKEASKSPSGVVKPICLNRPVMDFNNDCIVNMSDLATFATDWLACGFDIQETCWD